MEHSSNLVMVLAVFYVPFDVVSVGVIFAFKAEVVEPVIETFSRGIILFYDSAVL